MTYNIISTGSKGNAVLINNCIMIDCGVPYKYIEPYIYSLKLILLTHIHSDHFNKSTIKRIAKLRPTLRFGCCNWLVNDLVDCGVPKWRIDVYIPDTINDYRFATVSTFLLKHNVPNCGYKLNIDCKKIFYATDTNNLTGISATNYDLYLIEANYCDDEIQERIAEKVANSEYAYEYQVLKNHLSKQKCDNFLAENAGSHSEFIYMHGHSGIEYD